MQDVVKNKDKAIDVSGTEIGQMGAKVIATTIPFCDVLEEIRLNGCAVDDEGALTIFDELRDPNISSKIKFLELSNNPISERCFEPMLELVKTNP